MFWGYTYRPGDDVPENAELEEVDEPERVLRRRRREALAAGMSRVEASLYAESEIPTEQLRHLVELHCPVELLAKVLL